jgi:hypothetical protein
LGEEIGISAPAPFDPDAWARWLDEQGTATWARAAVLVWRRPWMTMNGDTYGSSLLELVGVENVFAPDEERYPQVTLEAISDRDPDCVLLPSEPYPFKERHIAEVTAALPDTGVRLDDGRTAARRAHTSVRPGPCSSPWAGQCQCTKFSCSPSSGSVHRKSRVRA